MYGLKVDFLLDFWYILLLYCLAGFYNETIMLPILTSSGRIRIECRAFVTETSEMPCCNGSNDKSLCQPETGIARVVVDIVPLTNSTISSWCKSGLDLNSIPSFALNDTCPPNGQPQHCSVKCECKLVGCNGSVTPNGPTMQNCTTMQNLLTSDSGTILVYSMLGACDFLFGVCV